jgi:hypothetical protein
LVRPIQERLVRTSLCGRRILDRGLAATKECHQAYGNHNGLDFVPH